MADHHCGGGPGGGERVRSPDMMNSPRDEGEPTSEPASTQHARRSFIGDLLAPCQVSLYLLDQTQPDPTKADRAFHPKHSSVSPRWRPAAHRTQSDA